MRAGVRANGRAGMWACGEGSVSCPTGRQVCERAGAGASVHSDTMSTCMNCMNERTNERTNKRASARTND